MNSHHSLVYNWIFRNFRNLHVHLWICHFSNSLEANVIVENCIILNYDTRMTEDSLGFGSCVFLFHSFCCTILCKFSVAVMMTMTTTMMMMMVMVINEDE